MKNIILLLVLFPLITFSQEYTKEMVKKGVDTTKYVPKGLQIGEEAPQITGASVDGQLINSKQILKGKKIVLIFYRGKWCPVCNKYLNNLNDSLSYITSKNTEVIVVGPETFDNAEKMVDKTKGDFVLVPDTSFKILADYDVLFHVTKKYQGKINTFLMTDIAKNNNQEEAILPVPATYIIGQDGKIKWRQFDYNYGIRASAREIINQLE